MNHIVPFRQKLPPNNFCAHLYCCDGRGAAGARASGVRLSRCVHSIHGFFEGRGVKERGAQEGESEQGRGHGWSARTAESELFFTYLYRTEFIISKCLRT